MWHEIFAGVNSCGLAFFFCNLRKLIFAIRTDWVFFCWQLIFAFFQEVPDNLLIVFSFLLSTCNGNFVSHGDLAITKFFS